MDQGEAQEAAGGRECASEAPVGRAGRGTGYLNGSVLRETPEVRYPFMNEHAKVFRIKTMMPGTRHIAQRFLYLVDPLGKIVGPGVGA